jgi:feruloyl esterase
VAAVLTPSSDSHIEIEVWMPAENWNGKFQAVGNGGWGGVISFSAMAAALQEGYATASTDTGHKGFDALFAIDHPEKLVDFAHRAVHEMTVKAKALIAAYYKRAPRLSYWNGCSTGGRQGLMAAQKYPEDFDAIIAGAPANAPTHQNAWTLSVSVPVMKDPSSAVPAAKLEMVTRAVLNACDARDGVSDGVLNNPAACRFDVASLQCKTADNSDCLTGAQVTAMKRAYEPARTVSGRLVFAGKALGSEAGFTGLLGGQGSQDARAAADVGMAITLGSFQIAYNNALWDPMTFDLDRDVVVADEKVGTIINAVSTDLNAFRARGGKLILYQGWNDIPVSPQHTIDYYLSVLERTRGGQDEFVRLFMAPGMNHCRGGVGPNQVDWVAALDRWRERGVAPDRVEASRVIDNRVDMTRPLCPYPQVAQYNGTGSTNEAANFVCKAP